MNSRKNTKLCFLLAMCLIISSYSVSFADNSAVLPLDGESWVNNPISDVITILTEAGYTKSEFGVAEDCVMYYRNNNSPEQIYLYYNKKDLKTSFVTMVFYFGKDKITNIVESYSIIYGAPSITNENGSDCYVWKNDGYQFTVTFETNYEEAKSGKSPSFVLMICSEKDINDYLDDKIEGNVEPVQTPAEELKIGQTLRLPFVVISFSKVQNLDKLIFTEKETGGLQHSLGKSSSNSKYIAIKGTIENKSKKSFDLTNGIRGKAYVDGYEYDIGVFSISSRPAPLDKSLFYIYALVPNKLANTYKKCEFRFGFNNNFETDYFSYSESEQYDYKYQIIIK